MQSAIYGVFHAVRNLDTFWREPLIVYCIQSREESRVYHQNDAHTTRSLARSRSLQHCSSFSAFYTLREERYWQVLPTYVSSVRFYAMSITLPKTIQSIFPFQQILKDFEIKNTIIGFDSNPERIFLSDLPLTSLRSIEYAQKYLIWLWIMTRLWSVDSSAATSRTTYVQHDST